MKQYKITLKNGEHETVMFLQHALFPVYFKGDASRHLFTQKYIDQEEDRLEKVDYTDPHIFYIQSNGLTLRNEGEIFAFYQTLRKPIIKLELIDSEQLTPQYHEPTCACDDNSHCESREYMNGTVWFDWCTKCKGWRFPENKSKIPNSKNQAPREEIVNQQS